MQDKLNIYAAIIGGDRIKSVFATGEMEARVKIYDFLDKPMSKGLLKRWVAQGCVVEAR